MRMALVLAGVLIAGSASGAMAQEPGGPQANPELTAVFFQMDGTLLERLEPLVEQDIPGAREIYVGFQTLIEEGDWSAACATWESAASFSAEAAHFTAECYQNGNGGVEDDLKAAELYRLAGEGGYPKSLCALGNLYMSGEGVPQDTDRGVALCQRGAEMGDPDAQTDLGNFYLIGRGVPVDKVQARYWYEQAVVHRQRNAAFILGQMYWYGDEVEQSDAEAFRYWELAWEEGRRDAALMLARSHVAVAVRDRQNIDRTALERGLEWYELAMPYLEGSERNKAREEQAGVRAALDALTQSQDQ